MAGREAERADFDRRQSILINELNHRVENTLATVQAIAAQTLRRAPGAAAGPEADLDQRLRALARAHDLLAAGTWNDTPLPRVIKAALAPWMETGRATVSYPCEGTFATLRPVQAQALVLALHELATNAAKYGALSGTAGVVTVSCLPEGEGARVEWREEDGPPIKGGEPQRHGFGSRLLERALPRELSPGSKVELRFQREGLGATIQIRSVPWSDLGRR